MIGTIIKISLLRLWNKKSELWLLIAVPILFFSIFALIFSRGVAQTEKQITVSIVNDDSAPLTGRIVRDLQSRSELKCVTGVGATAEDWPIEKLSRMIMGRLKAEIVIYFPAGFSDSLSQGESRPIQIHNEGTNPVSSQIVEGALAQTVAAAQSSRIGQIGYSGRPRFTLAGTSPLLQPAPMAAVMPGLNFEKIEIFASNKHSPKIAMYAAGIAVMFLLFSSSGAGASLLEEREAGTLGRLLTSQLTLNQLLLGKWIYISVLGFSQITIMFAWGQLVFHVDLLGHLPGFLILSLATSFACASFALCLATICRTRNQLNGASLVLVLSMSALGGSMIPRFIMSESMQFLGKFTFNGWALDGFKKIFWYDLPISAVKLEVTVLLLIAVVLGVVARIFAQRWSFT